MSDATQEQAAPEQAEAPTPAPLPSTCPRCGTELRDDQSWCLQCGLAARTRLAPTPNWRVPLFGAGIIGVLAVIALVIAFLVVTGDNAPVPQATSTAAPAAVAPPVTTAPAVTTTPTTTVPAATTPTTTVPAATAPATPVVPTTTPAPTGAG